MLYEANIIHRRGTVEQKNTVSDYHEIEQERGASVYATPLHTEWRDYKINILDTPGLDDFIGEIDERWPSGRTGSGADNEYQLLIDGLASCTNRDVHHHRSTTNGD